MSVPNTDLHTFFQIKPTLTQSFSEVRHILSDISVTPDSNTLAIISNNLDQVRECMQTVGWEAAAILTGGLQTLVIQIQPDSAAHHFVVLKSGLNQLEGYAAAIESQSSLSPFALVDDINAVNKVIGNQEVTLFQFFKPNLKMFDNDEQVALVLDDKRKNIVYHLRARFRRALLHLLHEENKENPLGVIVGLMANLEKLGANVEFKPLWKVAAGFTEAIRVGDIEATAEAISIIAKLDKEISRMWSGDPSTTANDVSKELIRSMLFYIGKIGIDDHGRKKSELAQGVAYEFELDRWFNTGLSAVSYDAVEDKPLFQEPLISEVSGAGINSIISSDFESILLKLDQIDQVRRNIGTDQERHEDLQKMRLLFQSVPEEEASKRYPDIPKLVSFGEAIAQKMTLGEVSNNVNITDFIGLLTLQIRQLEFADLDNGPFDIDLNKWQNKYNELIAEFGMPNHLMNLNGIIDDQIKTMSPVFYNQSELLMNEISEQLTLWRNAGVSEEVVENLRRLILSLKDGAATAEYQDIYYLCQAVERLLIQESGRIATDDSGLLNLLEEMRDGLAARLGMIPATSKNHVQSLTRMITLLLSVGDMPQEDFINIKAEAGQPEESEESQGDSAADQHAANSDTGATQALLVTIGQYLFAILIENLDRVMRVKDEELVVVDGQFNVNVGAQTVPVINLAELWGDASFTTSNSGHSLVLVYLLDRIAAFEVDKFEPNLETVERFKDGQPVFVQGYPGVMLSRDQSTVSLLNPEILSSQIGIRYDHCPPRNDPALSLNA